jgi:hypothetical protein
VASVNGRSLSPGADFRASDDAEPTRPSAFRVHDLGSTDGGASPMPGGNPELLSSGVAGLGMTDSGSSSAVEAKA